MVGLSVHHIQLSVKHGPFIISKLKQAGFKIFAQSRYADVRQWAMRSGTARFVITETKSLENEQSCNMSNGTHSISDTSLPLVSPLFVCPQSLCRNTLSGDTVFNVAFEPLNLEKTLDLARENRAHILHDLKTVDDGKFGHVRFAVIKSCLGNVIHTLLDTSQYKGDFLPGFISETDTCMDDNSHVTHFDHVTLACHEGRINEAMKWYESCLGMKRFLINRDEDEVDGMVVKEAFSGLRLKALEYWRCSELGLSLSDSSQTTEPTKPAFVFAEAISGPGPNQIKTFLEEHGCEGIQHIGLYTPDICNAVTFMRSSGLSFMTPPAEYYFELAKQQEVKKIEESLPLLQELSVLIDTEEYVNGEVESERIRYLMQVFSKPLFSKDTFFLELIQREGSQGFGSGNIKALWRAVAGHMARSKETRSDGMGT